MRQDLQAALKILGQDEIDDAHALLRDAGYRPEEFEILQRAERSTAYPSAVAGSVTLIRRRNRAGKTYPAGHGSSWLVQLEKDLKLGLFGPPRSA